MTQAVTTKIHFGTSDRGRREMRVGRAPAVPEAPAGRVPRVARLMALAIRFDGLIRDGAVADQAEIARFGHITRARMTQIMNLLHLAPDIQEQILDLPLVERGRDPVTERDLRPIAAEMDWRRQRRMWCSLTGTQWPQ
jgi:hypothetical protein